MKKQSQLEEEAVFPIGAVAEQTGVLAVTLRAWERRYGLLKPQRTPKGHRLYSARDIQHVRQILHLLDEGIPVGRVRDVLAQRRANDTTGELEAQTKRERLAQLNNDNPWPQYEELCRRCIHKLDARSLEQIINEAVSHYSLELVARKLFLPLCMNLHGQCSMLASTCAEYAFWYEFLCTKLGSFYLRNNSGHAQGARIILLGSSSPIVHLQMLLLAGVLGARGFNTSLLGNSCGPEHLPLVLERSHIDAVIFCTPDEDVVQGIEALSRVTPSRLLVQYLDVPHFDLPRAGELPAVVTSLPTAFDQAVAAVENLLKAQSEPCATRAASSSKNAS